MFVARFRPSTEGTSPNILQKVTVNVWQQQQCVSRYAAVHPITTRMLCFGENLKGTCQGDSGQYLVSPFGSLLQATQHSIVTPKHRRTTQLQSKRPLVHVRCHQLWRGMCWPILSFGDCSHFGILIVDLVNHRCQSLDEWMDGVHHCTSSSSSHTYSIRRAKFLFITKSLAYPSSSKIINQIA